MSFKSRIVNLKNKLRESTRPLRRKIRTKLKPLRKSFIHYLTEFATLIKNKYLLIKASMPTPFKHVTLPETKSTVNTALLPKMNDAMDDIEEARKDFLLPERNDGLYLGLSDIEAEISSRSKRSKSKRNIKLDISVSPRYDNGNESDEFEKVDDPTEDIKLVVKRKSRIEDEYEF